MIQKCETSLSSSQKPHSALESFRANMGNDGWSVKNSPIPHFLIYYSVKKIFLVLLDSIWRFPLSPWLLYVLSFSRWPHVPVRTETSTLLIKLDNVNNIIDNRRRVIDYVNTFNLHSPQNFISILNLHWSQLSLDLLLRRKAAEVGGRLDLNMFYLPL